MFGKKEKTSDVLIERIPVLNVQTIPGNYEIIQMLHVYKQFKITSNDYDAAYETTISKLGELGSSIGADAIIGLTFHTFGGAHIQSLHAFGTAIRAT